MKPNKHLLLALKLLVSGGLLTLLYRQTPLGREICDLMLAVNRPYHRADYIPCIAWGRTANLVRFCAVGTGLRLTACISRF